MSADSPYSAAPQKGRQRHKMQWKKLDKEGRGIDQRRHLTSPPSPVSVRLTLEESAERLARWCFAVTTHRPGSQSTRCKPICSSSLQLCTISYIVLQQQHRRVFCSGCCRPVQPQMESTRVQQRFAGEFPCKSTSCKLPLILFYSNFYFRSGRWVGPMLSPARSILRCSHF